MPSHDDTIGPYRLIKNLGTRQDGETWAAEDSQNSDATCTIFFPSSEKIDIEAIRRETGLLVSAGNHPHVLRIHEIEVYNGQLLIVRDDAESGSLLDWLKLHGGKAPSARVAAEKMLEILAGLHHLHQQRVLHRNLNPMNIMFRGETLVLSDYGLGYLLNSTTTNAESAPYMAPEALKSQWTVQSDLWSAGVIFYQLLSGNLPFSGTDEESVIRSIVEGACSQLPVGHPFQGIVKRVLQKDQSKRYRSAETMCRSVRRAMQQIKDEKPIVKSTIITEKVSDVASPSRAAAPIIQPLPIPPRKVTANISDRRLIRRIFTGLITLSLLVFVWAKFISVPLGDLLSYLEQSRTAMLQPSPDGGHRVMPKDGVPDKVEPTGSISDKVEPKENVPDKVEPEDSVPDKSITSEARNIDLGKGLVIEMLEIPPGNFLMGSSRSEQGRFSDEGPQHEVKLNGFLMGRYEITQRQWQAVTALPKVELELDPEPSNFMGDDLPVEMVSWEEAREFIARLNNKYGLTEKNGYRLPSEAEWEYAARAGVSSSFTNGAKSVPEIVKSQGDSLDWGDGTSLKQAQTAAVGSLGISNKWGLFDMQGNVYEWCEDDYHANYLGAPGDGSAWIDRERGRYRVSRGGAWGSRPVFYRPAYRGYHRPPYRNYGIGFRLARSLP